MQKIEQVNIFLYQQMKIKPRLHEQFLCDKFYLFASVRIVYTSNFYLKTKDWTLGSTDDIKNCQFYVLFRLHGQFSVCDKFLFAINTSVFQQV